jgi:hypothetical protein
MSLIISFKLFAGKGEGAEVMGCDRPEKNIQQKLYPRYARDSQVQGTFSAFSTKSGRSGVRGGVKGYNLERCSIHI